MISIQKLQTKFTFQREFLDKLISPHTSKESGLEIHEAARLLALHDVHAYLPTLGQDDLFKLYKVLEWPFIKPPRLTYDLVISRGIMLQVIPLQYLERVKIAEGD